MFGAMGQRPRHFPFDRPGRDALAPCDLRIGHTFHVMQQKDRARRGAQIGQRRLQLSYAVPPMRRRLGIGFALIDQFIVQGIMRPGAAHLVAPMPLRAVVNR